MNSAKSQSPVRASCAVTSNPTARSSPSSRATFESRTGLNIESYLNQLPTFNPATSPVTTAGRRADHAGQLGRHRVDLAARLRPQPQPGAGRRPPPRADQRADGHRHQRHSVGADRARRDHLRRRLGHLRCRRHRRRDELHPARQLRRPRSRRPVRHHRGRRRRGKPRATRIWAPISPTAAATSRSASSTTTARAPTRRNRDFYTDAWSDPTVGGDFFVFGYNGYNAGRSSFGPPNHAALNAVFADRPVSAIGPVRPAPTPAAGSRPAARLRQLRFGTVEGFRFNADGSASSPRPATT